MPTIAIVGGGVIGSGWAARFLLNGWNVRFFDPAPRAKIVLDSVLKKARHLVPEVYDDLPKEGTLRVVSELNAAVAGVDWIQESTSEKISTKQNVLRQIQEFCPQSAIIGSSTSGYMPSELQINAIRPEQIMVVHPYNPVYLLPAVECVFSSLVPESLRNQAEKNLRDVGMMPVVLNTEIPAHAGDRLLEAIWREALWLIHDGIVTTEQIDNLMTHGFGLRWAQKGLFETYRVAGGEAGMRHFLKQFGPHLQSPWTKLTDVPDLDDELIGRIVDQSDQQAAGRSVGELESERDSSLVAILKALRKEDKGAGAFLNRLKIGGQDIG